MKRLLSILLWCLWCSSAFAAPLFSDSFDSGSIDAAWGTALGVDATHYTPNTAQTTFVTTPTHSGAKALHYYTLQATNEHSPVTVFMYSSAMSSIFGSLPSEIYIEWYEYFETGYCWPTSSQKLFRLGYDDDGVHPESKKELGFLVQAANTDVNVQYFCGLWGNTSLCNVDGSVHSSEAHPLNTWTKWGYHAKLNTPGSADGYIHVYKNDDLHLSTGNVSLRGTDSRGFNYFWIGGNYSMLSGTLSCSGHRYIDDVAVYDTYPGAPTPTPTATPTSTPPPSSGGNGYLIYLQ